MKSPKQPSFAPRVAKPTGRYYFCSGFEHLHPQHVAVPVFQDRKGGFYGRCAACGTREFKSKLWTRDVGYTLQQCLDAGALIMNKEVT